ncbi:hypothetical protein Vretimale_13728, partial [Volvox reticuliferus]
ASVRNGVWRSRSRRTTLAATEPGVEPAGGSGSGDGNGGGCGNYPVKTFPGGSGFEPSRQGSQGDGSRRTRTSASYGNGSSGSGGGSGVETSVHGGPRRLCSTESGAVAAAMAGASTSASLQTESPTRPLGPSVHG